MSDDGYSREATGAAIVAAVGLVFAFIRGLFTRNVKAHDEQLVSDRATVKAAQDEMRADVKNILLELRSMHDEQTRQRGEIVALGKDLSRVSDRSEAAHARLDALVTTPPKGRGR